MPFRAPLLVALLFLALAPAAPAATTEQTLKRLGGKPCSKTSVFTCVTITVPLDHANPTNGETLDVVFAVRPGRAPTKGLLAYATGGPGSAGIALADERVDEFPAAVRNRFDVVFFDQRGVGRSGGLACPNVINTAVGANVPIEQRTQTFVTDCVGALSAPGLLPWVGTDQAIADLEAFRLALGGAPLWLYGESYGTSYAQAYAAKYPDALRGLILDGVIDPSLSGAATWRSAARSAERTLNATLAVCAARPACNANTGGDPAGTLDALRARAASSPIRIRYPLGPRRTLTRFLTADLLDTAVGSNLYTSGGRMYLQRAIASASRGDLKPMLELGYAAAQIDLVTNTPNPDPAFSTAMYNAVNCRDYSWYSGTREQRNAAFLAEAAVVQEELPRIGGTIFLANYACIWWPASALDVPRPAPLRNTGIPTFVLNADYDPITPVGQARAVARNLADGYLIVQRGGPHVIYGRGERCIDQPVNAFLLRGQTPTERRITCPGAVVTPYRSLGPRTARGFATPADAMRSFTTQITNATPMGTWDRASTLAMPCAVRGTLSARVTRDGALQYRYRNCSFTRGLAVTGSTTLDAAGRLTGTVRLSGRFAGSYRVTNQGPRVQVTPA